MDKATVIGLAVAAAAIIISILLGGTLIAFVDAPSAFVVIGGTIAALLIGYPMADLVALTKVIANAFSEKETPMKETIDTLVGLSEKARREGILAIEKALEEIEDDFLKNGLRLAVDGSEPEAIKDSMEIELENIEKRHSVGHDILGTGGDMAPAFGMIGTLIGLVNMLKNMSDPSAIGPSMAIALLTTFYGSVLANTFFIPIQGKLKLRSAYEITTKELIVEGVIGIQSGDNPRMLRSKLETYLPPNLRSREE